LTSSYRIVVDTTKGRLDQVGPLISGAWGRHNDELGREIRGEFLIDTGAYGAMIDLDTADMLGLNPQGSREVHGIHGYGRLRQYIARISIPALDSDDQPTHFSALIECVGVPSLRDKNRQHGADLIGILGRAFLTNSRFTVDNISGRVELMIARQPADDHQ